MCACKCTKKLDDYDLEDNSATDHSHKHIIVQDSFEHIYLLHLPRADLIENLEKTY